MLNIVSELLLSQIREYESGLELFCVSKNAPSPTDGAPNLSVRARQLPLELPYNPASRGCLEFVQRYTKSLLFLRLSSNLRRAFHSGRSAQVDLLSYVGFGWSSRAILLLWESFVEVSWKDAIGSWFMISAPNEDKITSRTQY